MQLPGCDPPGEVHGPEGEPACTTPMGTGRQDYTSCATCHHPDSVLEQLITYEEQECGGCHSSLPPTDQLASGQFLEDASHSPFCRTSRDGSSRLSVCAASPCPLPSTSSMDFSIRSLVPPSSQGYWILDEGVHVTGVAWSECGSFGCTET